MTTTDQEDLAFLGARVPRQRIEQLRELAWRRRTSVADVVRNLLDEIDWQGHLVAAPPGIAAPPVESELPLEARRLIQLLAGASSNLTQVFNAAQRAGAEGAGAFLSDLAARVQSAMLAAKRGDEHFDPEELEEPCRALNESVHSFNRGEDGAGPKVQSSLRRLDDALRRLA